MKAIIEFSSMQEVTAINDPQGTKDALTAIQTAISKLLGDSTSFRNGFVLSVANGAYLQAQRPDGQIAYTLGGNCHLNAQGVVVFTDSDMPVLPQITVPQDAISMDVDASGTVSVMLPGQITPQQIGQIQVAEFVNPAGLTDLGNGYFMESVNSGTAIVGTVGSGSFSSVVLNYIAANITLNDIKTIINKAKNDLQVVIDGL